MPIPEDFYLSIQIKPWIIVIKTRHFILAYATISALTIKDFKHTGRLFTEEKWAVFTPLVYFRKINLVDFFPSCYSQIEYRPHPFVDCIWRWLVYGLGHFFLALELTKFSVPPTGCSMNKCLYVWPSSYFILQQMSSLISQVFHRSIPDNQLPHMLVKSDWTTQLPPNCEEIIDVYCFISH